MISLTVVGSLTEGEQNSCRQNVRLQMETDEGTGNTIKGRLKAIHVKMITRASC
jgi:hypothetical protein